MNLLPIDNLPLKEVFFGLIADDADNISLALGTRF